MNIDPRLIGRSYYDEYGNKRTEEEYWKWIEDRAREQLEQRRQKLGLLDVLVAEERREG